jgi:molybdopterin-containing oxidoreductase family membrane subunit
VTAVFREVEGLAAGLREARARGLRELAVFSPVGLPGLEHLLPRRGSPIRFLVLAAGIAGCIVAFWMCIGSALLYGLIVGGKWPGSVLPYCVIGFEFTVLLGGLTAILAILGFARLRPGPVAEAYDPRFGVDRFGLSVSCEPEQVEAVEMMLREAGAEEVRVGAQRHHPRMNADEHGLPACGGRNGRTEQG